MTTLSFDPDNTLAGGLYAMSPREAISLAAGLCDATERAVGADGCHGGVWPGNITAADGQIALGPVNDAGIADMNPDALEFVAPELFWGGEHTPACDVYSIGLVLYTALNGGVMPFFQAGTEHSAEDRAAALRNRMKGKTLPYPASAGRELGDVVLKALSFRGEDRYATPGQLKAALCSLPESAAIPAAAPVIPLSSEELKNAHSYKVDKNFEPAEPEKKKKKQPKTRKPEGAVDEEDKLHKTILSTEQELQVEQDKYQEELRQLEAKKKKEEMEAKKKEVKAEGGKKGKKEEKKQPEKKKGGGKNEKKVEENEIDMTAIKTEGNDILNHLTYMANNHVRI